MESYVKHREAAVLRGAGQAEQDAHGKVPGLQVTIPRAKLIDLTLLGSDCYTIQA